MTGRAALAITAASIAAGVLNYAFQVHAATALDEAAFGLLSAWLAQVGVVGAAATVVQFLSLDFAMDDRRFTSLLRLAGGLAFTVLVAHLAFGNALSKVLLGVSTVTAGVVLYAVVGQLQARLRLGLVAASLFVVTALRFALPFVWPAAARAQGFYVAQAAAGFAGLAAAAVLFAVARRAGPSRAEVDADMAAPVEADRRLRLGRPLLLAIATVLFPLLDVLVISSTQNAATTGAFSRIQLASRVVFFAGAAALQLLLPHELHAAKHRTALPIFAARLQRSLAPGMIALALGLAAALDLFVLHPHGEARTWLYASCLSTALLVAILGHVNAFAAEERLGAAAATVAGVIVLTAAGALVALLRGAQPVSTYVVAVLAGDAVVLACARGVQMRSRPASAQGNLPP